MGNNPKILCRLGATILSLFVFGVAIASGPTPFKGWGSGMVIGANQQPTYLELTLNGTGQSTHLGRFSRTEVIQVNATGGITGTIVFTAANGDTLTVDVVGQFISPTTATGTYTITDGTGRFADSSGTAEFTAISPDGIHVTFEFDGSIS